MKNNQDNVIIIDFSKWNPPADPYLIDLTLDYPEPRYTLKINGVGVIPRGDIQAVKAKSKNGKSYLCTIFAGAMLGDTPFEIEATEPGRVLFFDTEQNERNTARMAKRVHRLMGWGLNENRHEVLRFYSLRTMKSDDRLPFIEGEVRRHHPTAVFVDGIADLTLDFNDLPVCEGIIQALMRLSAEMDCAVINVLHTNKSETDNNMKGHLGTMLLQKSSDVFMVQKQNGQFDVTLTDSRNAGGLSFAFALDDTGHPIPAENPEEKFFREATALFSAFFDQCFRTEATTADLIAWTMTAFKLNSTTAAERTIKKALIAGIIERPKRGVYRLAQTP